MGVVGPVVRRPQRRVLLTTQGQAPRALHHIGLRLRRQRTTGAPSPRGYAASRVGAPEGTRLRGAQAPSPQRQRALYPTSMVGALCHTPVAEWRPIWGLAPAADAPARVLRRHEDCIGNRVQEARKYEQQIQGVSSLC